MEIRSASALTGLKIDEKNKEKNNQPASKAPPTASLGQAVQNNESASVALKQMSNSSASREQREIGEANEEASRASVRDVEQAATMAKDLAHQISQNGREALDAQANQQPENVETLLR
jgi:hypothetical protein